MREFTFPDAMWKKLHRRFSAKPSVGPTLRAIFISCPLCDEFLPTCSGCPVYVEGDWCEWIFRKYRMPLSLESTPTSIKWPRQYHHPALAFLKRMVTWLESMERI
jgi:hypothetical protein